MTVCRASSRPLKSGTRISMMIPGLSRLTAAIVWAKCSAPPSGRSSRATAVMTTCFKLMRLVACATRSGSSVSSANGLAVFTAQNPQARVHRSPAIMNVAVPWLQHSQRLGHCASSHTVCSFRSATSPFVLQKTGLLGRRTFIQDGFLGWWSAGSSFAIMGWSLARLLVKPFPTAFSPLH